jgi:hypothetical protein
VIGRTYTYQKLTQFSQGNNVLDAHASNTGGFLSEIHVFHHLNREGLLEKTEPISTLKQLSYRKYPFQKLNQLSQGDNMQDTAVSNIDGFL